MITCQFENGHRTTTLRHVTVDAIIMKANKILLTKRSLNLLGGGKWAIPGGFMDRDETAAQAILREVLEETGYTGTVIKLLEIRDNPKRADDDRQNITFVYLVEPLKQVTTLLDVNEVTELRWFPLHQLPPASDMAFDHLEIIEKQYLIVYD